MVGRKNEMPLKPKRTHVNCRVHSGFNVPVIRSSKLTQALILRPSRMIWFRRKQMEIAGNGGNGIHSGGAFSTKWAK